MRRIAQALLAVLFLMQALPTAQATHAVPEAPSAGLPDVPEGELLETGVVPIDRFQRNATRDANESLDPSRERLADAQEALAAAEAGQPLPERVTLFVDSLDLDGRRGGFGDYEEVGTNAWGVTSETDVDPDPRLKTGTRAGGRYAGSSDALIVLPELDLRTGVGDPLLANAPLDDVNAASVDARSQAEKGRKDAYKGTPAEANAQANTPLPAAPQVPVGLSAVHRFLVQTLDLANSQCLTGPLVQGLVPPCLPGPGPHQDVDVQPREGLYVLEFERRMNLARQGDAGGRDGVQMLVFTRRPDASLIDGCIPIQELGNSDDRGSAYSYTLTYAQPDDPVCTIVETLDRAPASLRAQGLAAGDVGAGPAPRPTAAFAGKRAYTGFDDWRHVAIDLSPWGERQVWVAFRFASGNAPGDAYFRNSGIFQQNQGFYGIELDDFQLTAPGLPHSIRVRPIDDPWYRPYQHDERPAVAIGDDLPIGADLVNVGTRPVIANVTVRVVQRDAEETGVWSTNLGDILLGVGEAPYRVALRVPGLTENKIGYTVIVDALRSRGQSGVDEADPSDSIARLDVDVDTVRHLILGRVERQGSIFAAGDDLSFALDLRNDGNAPMTTVVRADLVNTVSEAIVQGVIPPGMATQTVLVHPGGTNVSTVRWSFPVQDAGQYRLFVRIDDDQDFIANRDLRPISIQPRNVPFVDGLVIKDPIMDGTIGASEWPPAAFEPIRLRDIYRPFWTGTNVLEVSGRLAAVADAENLFLLADLAHTLQVANGRDNISFLLDTGGDKPYQVPWSQIALTHTAPGQLVAEARVPLHGQPGGIPVASGGTIGVLVRLEDARGATQPAAMARFPLAGIEDGEAFVTPDGSQRDEMASWRPLRLEAPQLAEPRRLLSLGVGVDRAPPPLLQLDTADCADLAGWTQTYVVQTNLSGYSQDATKWNCAPYGEDGRTRLYEGKTPLARCGSQPCGQWSLGPVGSQSNVRYDDFLVTPPIEIPDIPQPYLVLRHQYATQVVVNDDAAAGETTLRLPELGVTAFTYKNTVLVPQKARVYYEELGPDGTWGGRVLLRPDGGYSSEESVGITNPVQARRMLSRLGTGPVEWNYDGWWWPTAEQPHYKPVGAPVATGATFHGSPWTVDRIPLFGTTHGDTEPPKAIVDPAGKTIRLLFAIAPTPGTPTVDRDPPQDYGWRIEGLAIAEGPQFARDLSVLEVAPSAARYDPVKLGLGPGTPVTINVTVANRGTDPVEAVRLCVRMLDVTLPPPGDASPCAGTHVKREGAVRILPGGQSTLNLTVTVPADLGARLNFLAAAFPTTGDDFPADNVLRNATALEVRNSPNLAVEVGTDQRIAGVGQSRALFVRITNQGNVPASGFTVRRAVIFEDGTVGGTPLPGSPAEWTTDANVPHGTVLVGESRSLDTIAFTQPLVPTTDLRMPGVAKSGSYVFSASVSLGSDINPQDNVASMILRTQDILASQPFSGSGSTDLVTTGDAGVWHVVGGTLLAGDPATGDIPVGVDATIELTQQPADLRSAKDAILTLKHRFDLEAADLGFDAGRVEISTNDGVDWRPLRPEPSPLQGLPDGYPSQGLTGDSALAALTLDETAVAFTGRSADLPGADPAGWIKSQFDLAQDPELSRRTAFEDFSLAALSQRPAPQPVTGPDGQPQFRAPDWVLAEPNAESRLRYWWIENATLDPAPHSPPVMWWSGTAGADLDDDDQELVQNRLGWTFAAAQPARAGDEVLMTWWQWRAGDADGGTGGVGKVALLDGPTDLAPTRPLVQLEEDAATGWKRFGIPITGLGGKPLTLRFEYDSASRDGFPGPTDANNRGWFVDDLQAVAFSTNPRLGLRYDPINLTTLDTLSAASLTSPGWSRGVVAGRAPINWTLVGRGAAARDGGWHVTPVEVPGLGEVPGWRFADGSRQGYPSLADSRLVTPLVDLAQARGDLRLQFDQQYWFESREKCPLDEDIGEDPQERIALGCFRSAIDGGAIEYQVFNPATRAFGPWQHLAKGFDDFPPPLYLEGKTDDCTAHGKHVAPPAAGDTDPANGVCTNHRRWTDRLAPGLPGNRRADFGGYPAVEERGMSEEALHVPEVVSVPGQGGAYGYRWGGSSLTPVGHGTSFEAMTSVAQYQIEMTPHSCGSGECVKAEYLRPWRDYPVSYVFSGASPGPGGWSNEAWDVSPLAGQQVRFAFHAATNPSLQIDSDLPEDPDNRGWSLANLRLVGDTLDGKPVRIRLHVATDSSLGAGEWRIDEATLNGERFKDNAAVLSDGPTTLVADRGATVRFPGRFATLGGAPLEGIVATLDAVRESDLEPYGGKVTMTFPQGLATSLDTDSFGPNTVAAYRLDPLDLDLQPAIPFTLEVKLPASDDAVLLRWSLLQDRGATGFVPFPLDVPGNAGSQWIARALRDERAALEPPTAGQARVLVTDPSVPALTEPVTVSTLLRNVGTTDPVLKAEFEVRRIVHKGGSAQEQPEAGAEQSVSVPGASSKTSIGSVAPGSTLAIERTFIPDKAGLYRIRITIETAAGKELATATTEILVGMSPTYHAVDFAQQGAQQAGWSDASAVPGTNGGGSPDALRWRDIGDRFLWGVTDSQFGGGTTYCSDFAACHGGANTGPPRTVTDPGEPPSQIGLDGRAQGPPITLDRVPDGRAFVTLLQSHNFEADDGARVEFMPLAHGTLDPAFSSPSTWCPGGVTYVLPAAFEDLDGVARSVADRFIPGIPATGNGNEGKPGEHTPDLLNPLTQLREKDDAGVTGSDLRPRRVIGGAPVSGEAIRFDLSRAATPACPLEGSDAPAALELLNYTVVPFLHAGTRPGFTASANADDVRRGAQGWAIHSLQVSSRDIEANPGTPTFPLQAGAPKTFFVLVTNNGQAADRVTFSIDPLRSTVPDGPGEAWIDLPPDLTLDAGQTRRVPVRVAAPGDAQAGTYLAAIRVASVNDPLTFDEVLARVPVRTVLLPDLALSLQPDLPPGTPFEAGTVVPVHVTVFNIGASASRQTQVVLQALDPSGAARHVKSLAVPPLCPPTETDCLGPSKFTQTIEWSVPRDIGAYRLQGHVDAAAVIDEISETNNGVDLDAAVSPLRQPDLAITSLSLNGTTGGFAEEGSLVVISVEAKNVGDAVANNVRVKIRFGSATVKEARVPSLAPGQTVDVSVAKVVSRGDFILAASVTHDAPDANVDNDDVRRPLRVRGHDLSLRAIPENVTVAPGSTVAFTVNATNNGNGVERVSIGLAPGAVGWGLRVLPNPMTLAPGQTGSASVELSSPESADAGPTVLQLVAIPSGQAASKVSLALPVTISVRPGAPTLRSPANQSVAPGNATLTVNITSASNALQALLVQVEETGWAPSPTEIRLEPGEHRTLDLAFRVPPAAVVGLREVNVTVRDIQKVLLRSTPVQVLVEPVAMLTATWSGAARQDSSELGIRHATFTLRVNNTGNVPLRPRIELIGLGAGITAADPPAAPVLAPGEQWLAQVVLRLQPDVEDAFGVAEVWAAEAGTRRFSALQLPSLDAAPDLHIAAVQLTPRGAIAVGQTARVHATVENIGGVEAPASVVFVAVNGLLVAPVSIASLAPGASVDVTANLTFTEAGEYLVSVVADGLDAVAELQDTDNARTVPVDVDEASLPDRLRGAPAGSPWMLAVALLALAIAVRRRGGRT